MEQLAEFSFAEQTKHHFMPEQKPGRSKQNYATPPEFIKAVKQRLNIDDFCVDLAAEDGNNQCDRFVIEANNSLTQDWTVYHEAWRSRKRTGWLWLNPPYSDIKPWVEKAHYESMKGSQIAVLIPASVGANWWAEWVANSSYQLFLNGRITFQGCTTPYPKDCALLLYTPFIRSGNAVWNWRS